MKEFRLTWVIEVNASNPMQAARKALRIQQDPSNEATVFEVEDVSNGEKYTVDLFEGTVIKHEFLYYELVNHEGEPMGIIRTNLSDSKKLDAEWKTYYGNPDFCFDGDKHGFVDFLQSRHPNYEFYTFDIESQIEPY